MSRKHQDAGRLGGLTTSLKYGHDFYVAMGKKGGRPRAKTIADIPQPAPKELFKKGDSLPSSLTELKKLYRLRCQIQEGELTRTANVG